ncbi:hypothetical protein M0813_12530 [Anaeramoeba flamelloides]|uniref:Uncharacterized protein n=1 Tax=Anaeramoeba flamelloides TaxID=1746091 RepID=A0ABQ8ZBT4_9EUKA|nr:hypothetical protein M0813_12530 [Anaeramoeba flamelloides]
MNKFLLIQLAVLFLLTSSEQITHEKGDLEQEQKLNKTENIDPREKVWLELAIFIGVIIIFIVVGCVMLLVKQQPRKPIIQKKKKNQ